MERESKDFPEDEQPPGWSTNSVAVTESTYQCPGFVSPFVNQTEKEKQARPQEEVAKEELQVDAWPQLLDSLLPDPRALGPALWF